VTADTSGQTKIKIVYKAFEMWIWRRMKRISWMDGVTNKDVLRKINEDEQMLNAILICH